MVNHGNHGNLCSLYVGLLLTIISKNKTAMLKTKHLFIIFIPAILIVCFALFIRIVQYEPLVPEDKSADKQNEDLSLIPIFPDDPIIGNKKAATTIIAFEDFGCEACKTQTFIFDKLLEKYPDKIKIIWKGLPVTQFPHPTETAHQYAYCANEQNKFVEFEKFAFTNSDNLSAQIISKIAEEIGLNEKALTKCLESGTADAYIEKVKQLALILNVQAVPAIFIDNKQIQPPQLIEEWETILRLN